MIYLDNAATTFPKPISVRNAVSNSFIYSANPGRAGHRLSLKAAETIYNCRKAIADFYSFSKPENIILTSCCTEALNIVIKGVLRKGDHVVISSLEHNSVVRPLERMQLSGEISYSVATVSEDSDATVDSFRAAMRNNTRLIICTQASNVFGIALPIERIGALAHFYGALMCVDAAQGAGVLELKLGENTSIDYLCAPGHKGLYGPMGTGFLIINSDTIPESLTEGGTGSGSHILTQPDMLPDKLESGTLNLHGFAGLEQGIGFVIKKGTERIYHYELELVDMLYDGLSSMKEIELYSTKPSYSKHAPLISFNIRGVTCETVAQQLDKQFAICVRSGLHCSPLAHRAMGTDNIGTIRLSPSAFTTKTDIQYTLNAIIKLIKYKKSFFDIAI